MLRIEEKLGKRQKERARRFNLLFCLILKHTLHTDFDFGHCFGSTPLCPYFHLSPPYHIYWHAWRTLAHDNALTLRKQVRQCVWRQADSALNLLLQQTGGAGDHRCVEIDVLIPPSTADPLFCLSADKVLHGGHKRQGFRGRSSRTGVQAIAPAEAAGFDRDPGVARAIGSKGPMEYDRLWSQDGLCIGIIESAIGTRARGNQEYEAPVV